MEILVKNCPQKEFKKAIEDTTIQFLRKHSINPQAKVSVFFVSKIRIRGLNNKYRHLDQPTDVLSFPIWGSLKDMPRQGEINLGDIFVCLDVIEKEATEEKTSVKRELTRVVEHSLDHLIGKHH